MVEGEVVVEPVAVPDGLIEEASLYKKSSNYDTDIDLLFPDLQPQDYVAASVASFCNVWLCTGKQGLWKGL